MLGSKPFIGLDITSTTLTAVALKKKGKVYAVDHVAVSPLSQGIVDDGEVVDVERLAEALRAFWVEHKLPVDRVHMAVANQRVILRLIETWKIKKKKDLEDAVRFEAADHLPIPIDDTVVAFHPLDTFESPEGGIKQRIVVVAAYRDMVERYAEAFEKAQLKLERIDYSAFALMRAALASSTAFAGLQGEDGGAVALCDIGPSSTNVVIAHDGACEYARLLPLGTNVFSQTLADQFGWSFDDASRVRMEAGVLPLGGAESPGDPYTASRQVLQQVADQLGADIRTTIDYYAHSHSRAIGRVVISGEGALLRGIEQQLATAMNLPVSILDASPRLDPKAVDKLGVNHAHMAIALGLGMEEAA